MSTDEKQPTSAEKLSRSDTIDSLTGYEEITIEQRFGDVPARLLTKSLSRLDRSLIFVLRAREGVEHAKAYDHAMSMRLVDVNEFFLSADEEVEDFDAEEPDTLQGKGASPSD